MIESEVIKEEMTSGDAGCIDTRFEECAEGPDIDFRREFCRERYGIGGGFSMALCNVGSVRIGCTAPTTNEIINGLMVGLG